MVVMMVVVNEPEPVAANAHGVATTLVNAKAAIAVVRLVGFIWQPLQKEDICSYLQFNPRNFQKQQKNASLAAKIRQNACKSKSNQSIGKELRPKCMQPRVLARLGEASGNLIRLATGLGVWAFSAQWEKS